MKGIDLGRYVFGLSAIAFGVLAFIWRDFNIWQQVRPLAIVHGEILLYVIAVIEILGGLAVLWPRTARAGAVALGAVYLFFALLWLPLYIEKPIYDRLSNFFEQFSLVSAALIVYAISGPNGSPKATTLARIGYYGFAVSVVSFTVEQAVYLHGTAEFVPKWIPPGQMFWAVTTTVAFALAAIALLTGRYAWPASQWLTLMIAGFGLLVWLPAPFIAPHSLTAWAGNAENWAICGASWIVADYLRAQRSANW